jgi:hypothetical protein
MPRYPTPEQYQRAVLSAAQTLADFDLQAGQVTPGLFGLPQAVCGPFAIVFPFQAKGRKWAVRCFLTPAPDREERYRHLGAALARRAFPFLVPFEYQPRGIRVEGEWFPIVKMPWAEGEELHRYVEANLDDRKALGDLARQVLEVAGELERQGLAHGDLQHGNVLVGRDELKLIDYDGMFVPALRGRPTPEVGHANYQHPGRDEKLFSERMDRFSVWVICLSLLALRAAPHLWAKHHGGDERLLLSCADFKVPEKSAVFRDLLALPDATVRGLTEAFLRALALPAEQFPPLTRFLARRQGLAVPPAPAPDPGPVSREVYVSYAWGEDDTPQGRQREEVVDRLEVCLQREGYRVVRDKSALRCGDWISKFMLALGRASRIVVVLSDKYLRSPYCLQELFLIYQRACGDKREFLRRIVTAVLDDAHIDHWKDRIGWSEYWRAVYEEMHAHRDQLGRADDERRRLIQHWHLEVGDMLAYLADTIAPRGFEAIVKDDFAAIREALAREER